MVSQSRQTSQPSKQLFDSRQSRHLRGVGFPHCSTEIARCAPNLRDPHGYYAKIGVKPWATHEEIRFRVRQLYRTYHPDVGSEPDVEMFQLVRNIADVLLDPDKRTAYNRTPPGMRLMDKVYEAELSKLDELYTLNEDEWEETMRPQKIAPTFHTGRWDYFAIDHRATDVALAERWYRHLIAAAPRSGYRQVLKVMLYDNRRPAYDEASCILMIPRTWEPSDFAAFALFTKVAGASVIRQENSPTPFLPFDRYLAHT